MKRWFAAVSVFLALLTSAPAWADVVRTENVEAEIVSSRAAAAAGERFTIALRQSIREGWHTYWRNPGDSGEPTELTWTTPAGYTVGDLQWPAPEAVPFSTLVNHGYHGEVLFPIEVTVPASAQPGSTAHFSADAYWLVCSDICIPEQGTLSFDIPIAAAGRDDPQWAPRIADAVAALPRRLEGAAHITGGDPARLSLQLAGAGDVRNPRFFAYSRDLLLASAPQHPRVGDAGLSFDVSGGILENVGAEPVEGVITYERRSGGGWVSESAEVVAEPGAVLPGTDTRAAPISDDYVLADLEQTADSAPAGDQTLGFAGVLAALGLAFLGGLILNIMPCVLPVLSVKALSLAGGAHTGEARRHGLIYFAGVMVTFLALAGLLIALRGAGESVGWGFQLQAPWVTAALALLFFVIGLNLLGVFEIGGALQNTGAGLTARGGDVGAFFTGVLAVVAATPCTAPFMAGAIGAALTQSAGVTLLIFAALGVGFALPMLALHLAPGLQRLIPKPGPWMERARHVLAFPMFAAAAWLGWILTEQTGAGGAFALMGVATAVSFALYVGRWGRAWMIAGALVLVLTAAVAWRPLLGMEQSAALAAEDWSPARVAELRGEGRAVFVDFTAAWCVTCKVNELNALSSARVAQAFADSNTAFLRADWTNRDDAIAAELAAHGRAGVPLYLYLPADGEPVVLPQVLTEDLVIDTISN